MKIFILLLCTCSICFSISEKDFVQKLNNPITEWMIQQIKQDLTALSQEQITERQIIEYYDATPSDHYLVLFRIRNNQISTECKNNSAGIEYRKRAFEDTLKAIAECVQLPDTTFLLSMHDAYTLSNGIPVFSMCKREFDQWAILVPDFEALREKFQVLPKKNLTLDVIPWKRKKDQLIWRGSTAQSSFDGELMNPYNTHRFSRVILCEMSQKYPELINAKFTFFAQGGENIPYLQNFYANQMPFEELVQYKYHLFIDGNVSPYSASCWKFFINSLVFKPESSWIQWYFKGLKPYDHYIPVAKDLSDLIEKIEWAKNHDDIASKIAAQCREFSLNNLTIIDHWIYIYSLLQEYSQFVYSDSR